MDFKTIVNSRYAAKKFTGEEIDDSKVNELLEMIKLSASSFGLQPYKVIVVSSQELKDQLQVASWNQEQIGTASQVLVFCANTKIMEQIDKYEQMMKDVGVAEKKIEFYVGMMRDFLSKVPEERQLIWAQKQAYIALGNALNGAKALGFDSCPMEGFDAEQYAKILKLEAHLIPTVVCPIGIAADELIPKLRFDDLFEMR